MITLYIQKLEQIIADMQAATTGVSPPEYDYQAWLEFLKQVCPESKLLAAISTKPDTPSPQLKNVTYSLQMFTDVREIMLLADTHEYPTWYIQPSYTGLILILEYEQDMLTNILFEDTGKWNELEIRSVTTIPKTIPGFSGKIRGTLHLAQAGYTADTEADSATTQIAIYENYLAGNTGYLLFTAQDLDMQGNFMEIMRTLEYFGLRIPEFVLFPTDRIPSIPSSTLETLFDNYMSKAGDSVKVDGLMIISDTPLKPPNNNVSTTRIVYRKPSIIN